MPETYLPLCLMQSCHESMLQLGKYYSMVVFTPETVLEEFPGIYSLKTLFIGGNILGLFLDV